MSNKASLGLLFECPVCYRVVVNLCPTTPRCGGIISPYINVSTEHDPTFMTLICTIDPTLAQENIEYGLMANDIGEAMEKTNDKHGLSFGDRAIVRALPQFLAAVIKAQTELDREEEK